MKTEILRADHPIALSHTQDVLNHGGLVVFPTDTVYGLAASLNNPQAVEGLFIVKGLGSEKAVAVLIGKIEELDLLARNVSPAARRLVQRFWPGPLTVLVAGNPRLLSPLIPQGIVGLRMPDHPFALELLRRTGPLAVTSASGMGRELPRTAREALQQLNGRVHLVIDGGAATHGVYSTVVDCTGPEIALVRKGAIAEDKLLLALE